MIGIIPEKALKLSVNDFMRYQVRNKDGSINLGAEAFAGGVAGFAQVIITSPMEMFKIRMQLQNKKPEHLRQGVSDVSVWCSLILIDCEEGKEKKNILKRN